MDSVTAETRSRMMASIHGANTRPELFVRSGLFARGYRYRANAKDLPGHPDLKLTKHKAVIMVHGCFWHGHACRFYRLPSSNTLFWRGKISRTRARDLRDLRALREAGWRVAIVWECAVRLAMAGKDGDRLLDGLAAWVERGRPFVEFHDSSALVREQGEGTRASGRKPMIGRNSSIGAFAAEREPGYGKESL